jgi:SAM-dependent methyltransferase
VTPVRKDYMAVRNTAATEIDFVADYWTKVWREQGDPTKRLSRIVKKPEFRVMAPYLGALPRNARILDGGCGLGEWTVALSQMGYEMRGIDISGETIAKLRELFPDAVLDVGDIRDTHLASGSLDAYFSWGVFEHFEEGMQRCIAEAFRLLRPGGFLFVTVPFDNLRHAVTGCLLSGRQPALDRPLRFYQWRLNRAELARELAMGGFEVVEVRPIHKRQGVLRLLHETFGLDYNHVFVKAMSAALSPFVPALLVAHMLMAVARKPGP